MKFTDKWSRLSLRRTDLPKPEGYMNRTNQQKVNLKTQRVT